MKPPKIRFPQNPCVREDIARDLDDHEAGGDAADRPPDADAALREAGCVSHSAGGGDDDDYM